MWNSQKSKFLKPRRLIQLPRKFSRDHFSGPILLDLSQHLMETLSHLAPRIPLSWASHFAPTLLPAHSKDPLSVPSHLSNLLMMECPQSRTTFLRSFIYIHYLGDNHSHALNTIYKWNTPKVIFPVRTSFPWISDLYQTINSASLLRCLKYTKRNISKTEAMIFPSKPDLSIASVPSDFLTISFSNYSGLKPWYFPLSYLISNLAINAGSSNFQSTELFSLILFFFKIFYFLLPST